MDISSEPKYVQVSAAWGLDVRGVGVEVEMDEEEPSVTDTGANNTRMTKAGLEERSNGGERENDIAKSKGGRSSTTGSGSMSQSNQSSSGSQSSQSSSVSGASTPTPTQGSMGTSGRRRNRAQPTLTGPRTTVTIQGLPLSTKREALVALFHSEGFGRCFDLVYVPMDYEKQTSLGFALVNLTTVDAATRFFEYFSTFPVLTVKWSKSVQGLIPLVEQYRNSPVMHESVPDELKPALFVEGKRTPFPKPTAFISMPAVRHCATAF